MLQLALLSCTLATALLVSALLRAATLYLLALVGLVVRIGLIH